MFLIFISIWFFGTSDIILCLPKLNKLLSNFIFSSSFSGIIFILLKLIPNFGWEVSLGRDDFDWLRIKAAEDWSVLDILEDAEVLILLDKDEFVLKRPKRFESFIEFFTPKFNEESLEYINFCFGWLYILSSIIFNLLFKIKNLI